jgi:predicted amidohydrolase
MIKTGIRFSLLVLAIILLLWFLWLQIDFAPKPLSHIENSDNVEFVAIGPDSSINNVLGIQPMMNPADYASKEHFRKKIDSYFKMADEQGWINENTLVLLPEYIGTWLVAADEKAEVYTAPSIQSAMLKIIISNPYEFAKNYISTKASSKAQAAVFAMKAEKMREIYTDVFSNLAAKYNCHVLAGSVVSKLESNNGQDPSFYNISMLFAPDGSSDREVITKAYPIIDELGFTKAADVSQIPVFNLPIGNVAAVICADSWYPDVYAHLAQKQAQIMLVPSFSSPAEMWDKPWQGYNGAPTPSDVDTTDRESLSEKEAWLKYSMGGRAQNAGILYGMNIFLQGNLWDLSTGGEAIILHNGEISLIPNKHKSLIVSLFLP